MRRDQIDATRVPQSSSSEVMGGNVAPIRTIRADHCCRRSVNPMACEASVAAAADAAVRSGCGS